MLNFIRHRILSLSLVVVVLFPHVFAQQKEVGSDWPSVERLRAHVTYLASDELDGRATGTPGARRAAEYIVREFARYGLRPVISEAGEKRYMQNFPFVEGVELGSANSMMFRRPSAVVAKDGANRATETAVELDLLRLGEDWMPLGFSANAQLSDVPLTFAGYGIKAGDLSYDDYAGANLAGRVAVVFAGTPDGDNPHGKFARYASVRWKAIAAREHGAAALLVIARETNFKDEPLARLRYDNTAGDAGLPVVVVSRQAAARLLEAGGLAPLAELETGARAQAMPAPATATETSIKKSAAAPLRNVTLKISTEVLRKSAPASNVVGVLEGSDPKLKSEAIVIGAHYDHLGRGGEGSLAAREGEVHHGADDNASGVAGMLELARLFSMSGSKRTIVFIAFGGEELGLLGSNFYVNHPVVPLAQTVAMINMDMIGRLKDNRLIVGGVGTAQEWRAWIEEANTASVMKIAKSAGAAGGTTTIANVPVVVGANGKPVVTASISQPFLLTLNEDGYGPSDHASFYAKQVPVLFFWTGAHADYHKPSDTSEKIDYEAEARIISLVAKLLNAVSSGERRPTFVVAKSEPAGRATGFRVYLGTIPNYADSTDGLKLDGVREDSPAGKAGLKAGDRIVKLAGHEVRNIDDYTYALGEMKPGVEYDVEVVREGKPLRFKITPTARK